MRRRSESVALVSPSQQHLGVMIRQAHARVAQALRDRFANILIDSVAMRHEKVPTERKADLAIDRLYAIHQ